MWTKDVFTSVYSRITANGKIRLKSKYPKITFTNSTPKSKITSFPTVIISELDSSDTAQTLEGDTVNATYSNIQIEVITNSSQQDADNVADVCYDLISAMRYGATLRPLPSSTQDNEYRNVARYRRLVGKDDII